MTDTPDETANAAKVHQLRVEMEKLRQDSAAVARAANAALQQRTQQRPTETVLMAFAIGMLVGRCLRS